MRDLIVLRLIAVDRAIHFVVLALLAIAVLLFANDQKHLPRPLPDRDARASRASAAARCPSTTASSARIDRAADASHRTLYLIAGGLGLYAVIEGVEVIGLWLMKRWAEYLMFVATSLFLPWNLWSWCSTSRSFKVVAITVNVAVLAYLLWASGCSGSAAATPARRSCATSMRPGRDRADGADDIAGGRDGGTLANPARLSRRPEGA